MNKLHAISAILLIIVLLFALPLLVNAQEATETPPAEAPATDSTAPLDYAAFASLGGVALLVYVAMEIAKKVPFLAKFDAFKLSAFVTLILYVGYQVIFIAGGDVGGYLGRLTDIGTLGNALLAFASNFAGAAGLHHTVKNTKAMMAPQAPSARPLD